MAQRCWERRKTLVLEEGETQKVDSDQRKQGSIIPQSKKEEQDEQKLNCKNKRPKEPLQPDSSKRHAFVYGNYNHYYGYRFLNTLEEDPRMQYLEKEWFEGRDCLDVGCNAGNLTIHIAKKFGCKSMLGVDIDPALISKARKLLDQISKNSSGFEQDKFETTLERNLDIFNESTTTNCANTIGLSKEELLQRVSFKAQNIVQHVEADPTYDTVLCLSVTKWVHLNWGDDGLIRLFAKIRNLLRPGGIFVLEPQPWKSYKSNRLVSEVTRRNFDEIILRPEHFRDILLDKIGFRTMENITQKVTNSAQGFSRPIYLLRR